MVQLKTSHIWLILAGLCNIVLALIHIWAMFIGARAYALLDAGDVKQGSWLPVVITIPIVIFFIFCTVVAAMDLGLIRRLPYLTLGLKLIGSIYMVRGLAFFWFVWLWWIDSPEANLNEIWYSLAAILIGICYFLGLRVYINSQPRYSVK